MRQFSLFVCVMILSACAFQPSPAPSQGSQLASEDGNAEIFWQEQEGIKRKLVLKDGVYLFTTPITLPAVVPDQIRLQLSRPVTVEAPQIVRCVALASTSEKDDQPVALPLTDLTQEPRAQVLQLNMKISGVRSLLSDVAESSSLITLDCFDKNTQRVLRAMLRLTTPPAKVTFTHYKGQDVESAQALVHTLRNLDAPQARLTLYDVVKVENSGEESAQVSVPAMIPAKLWSRFTENRWESTSTCSSETRTVVEDVSYATEAYLYLLSEDLTEKFLTYGDRIEFTLPTGSTALVGIYLKGDQPRALKGGNVPPVYQSEPKEVVQRCDYSCEKASDDHIVLYLNSWGCRRLGEPNCDDPQSCVSCWKSNRMCQVCYRFDTSQNWDWPKRYCYAWHLTPITAQLKTHKSRTPIVLDFDPSASQAQLRSAFAPKQDDPSAREVVFLNPQSKHWE